MGVAVSYAQGNPVPSPRAGGVVGVPLQLLHAEPLDRAGERFSSLPNRRCWASPLSRTVGVLLSPESSVFLCACCLRSTWTAQVNASPDSLMGGVPRAQKMLKGHLPRVIYHQVY